jgi:hypothetical protein
MKFFGLTITLPRRRILIVRPKRFDEDQLNRVFAVEETHEMFQALLQLLETAKENAHDNAAAELKGNNPLLVAGYTGGAQHIDMVREDIVARRQLGLKAIRDEFR